MKQNNKKSILIAASICTLGAAVVYALKWVKFYLFSVSVWQVADLFDNMSKWGMESFDTYSWITKGGAILAIVLLIVDVYRIAKPLFDGLDDVESAQSACIGHIVSIIYTIAFIIFVLNINDGDFDGATITAWPVISIALNIAARVLLGNLQDNKEKTNPLPHNNDLSKSKDIMIPVFNYSSDCDLQPCELIYAKKSRKNALLMACYSDPSIIQSIKFSLSLFDSHGNVTECGMFICTSFQTHNEGSITYIMTNAFDIPQILGMEVNSSKARVIIKRIDSIGNQIALPITYRSSGLSINELKQIKTVAKDAICKKEIKENSWLCECGKSNKNHEVQCSRCKRIKNAKSVFSVETPEGNNSWYCSCGAVASGNYCSNCGKKRPDHMKWNCVCGQKGNTGNFCSNCGKRKI